MAYITDFGMICSEGLTKDEVAETFYGEKQFSFIRIKKLNSGNSISELNIPFFFKGKRLTIRPGGTYAEAILQCALDQMSQSLSHLMKNISPERIGVIIGSSVSGMKEGEAAYKKFEEKGAWPYDFLYQQQEISSPSAYVAKKLKVSGPSFTVSTACSSGAKAFISAQRLIDENICDAVIVGGVDTISELVRNGFDSLELLDEKLCNPFAKNRSNITLGEGAALFILQREPIPLPVSEWIDEKCHITSEKCLVSLDGFGESSDAHHMNAPDPSAVGAIMAINSALKRAQLTPEDISYVNLHGTGTQLNDQMEANAISQVFQNGVLCSSTKPRTGHTLGAAGAIEVGILCLAMLHRKDGKMQLPFHMMSGEYDDALPAINLVQITDNCIPADTTVHMMSNSFAFGGSNISLLVSGANIKTHNQKLIEASEHVE